MKEVRIINSYNDSELNEFVNAGRILKVTEERAEALINAKVAEELVVPEVEETDAVVEPTEPEAEPTTPEEGNPEEGEPTEEGKEATPEVEDAKVPEAAVEKATLKDKSNKKNK